MSKRDSGGGVISCVNPMYVPCSRAAGECPSSELRVPAHWHVDGLLAGGHGGGLLADPAVVGEQLGLLLHVLQDLLALQVRLGLELLLAAPLGPVRRNQATGRCSHTHTYEHTDTHTHTQQ